MSCMRSGAAQTVVMRDNDGGSSSSFCCVTSRTILASDLLRCENVALLFSEYAFFAEEHRIIPVLRFKRVRTKLVSKTICSHLAKQLIGCELAKSAHVTETNDVEMTLQVFLTPDELSVAVAS